MKTRSAYLISAALTLFLVSGFLFILTPAETLAATTFTATAVTSASQVSQGSSLSFTLKVKNTNNKSQKADVIATITDSSGKTVFSQAWTGRNFSGNQEQAFSAAFATTTSTAAGNYQLGVQVQSPGSGGILSVRATLFYSNPSIANFTVATQTVAPLQIASPVYWGVYMDGVPWDMTKLSAVESAVGKGASIVHFGQPWMHAGVYYNFPTSLMETIRKHGSIPMLNWGSWDYCCGPDQSAWKLSNIYNGTYDTFIWQFALAAKAWGYSFFLRFDHEMNGFWQFPWSEQLNGNQPGDYVLAWKHVHDIFTAAGATNVTWVWSPNVAGPKTTPLENVYPGDSYVDWVGIDGYNWGTDHNNVWQSFSEVFSTTYAAVTQLAPGKPVMLAETAASENGGDKAAWIRDALQTQLPVNFPQIKAVVWFDWDAGDSTLSWPITSSQTSLDAFKQSLNSSFFASNTFSALSPQIIKALPR